MFCFASFSWSCFNTRSLWSLYSLPFCFHVTFVPTDSPITRSYLSFVIILFPGRSSKVEARLKYNMRFPFMLQHAIPLITVSPHFLFPCDFCPVSNTETHRSWLCLISRHYPLLSSRSILGFDRVAPLFYRIQIKWGPRHVSFCRAPPILAPFLTVYSVCHGLMLFVPQKRERILKTRIH